eukprot:912344-Lingulodinium_polyedra.AAC.1
MGTAARATWHQPRATAPGCDAPAAGHEELPSSGTAPPAAPHPTMRIHKQLSSLHQRQARPEKRSQNRFCD